MKGIVCTNRCGCACTKSTEPTKASKDRLWCLQFKSAPRLHSDRQGRSTSAPAEGAAAEDAGANTEPGVGADARVGADAPPRARFGSLAILSRPVSSGKLYVVPVYLPAALEDRICRLPHSWNTLRF
jgi:hypothetical protein